MSLSLAELDALETEKNKDGIKPGDGTPTPADLEAARQKQADADAEKVRQQQQQKTPEQLAEEQRLAEEASATEAATKLAARIAELKARPADQLTPEEKVELETAEEPEAEAEDDPIAFWNDVDKLSGDPVEIKWETHKNPDGTPIAPDSPQGALIREKAVVARAVERFEADLAKNDRRGYQYLLHRQAGKTDEEFFSQKTPTLPNYEALKDSVDLQTKVYSQLLAATGLPERQIKLLVDDAVAKKEIGELADRAYKTIEANEASQVKKLQEQLDREATEYNSMVVGLSKLIDSEIASTSLSIVIPDAKRPAFAAFVKSLVTFDEEKRQFLLAQPISKEALPRQLEALFLQHNGGKITGIVERQAATLNTRRLKRQVDNSKEQQKNHQDTNKQKKTLGEL